MVRTTADSAVPTAASQAENPIPPAAAVSASGPPSRGQFYPLAVEAVHRLTADCATVTFAVPEALRHAFRFSQGQHITLRCDLGGKGVRRNYSICSAATSGELRIAVKHLPGGAFSTHVLEKVRPGDVFDVMPPSGRFFTRLDASQACTYVGIAGGSGITPIFSILSTALEVEQRSRFILLFGNRDIDSIMFRDELRVLREQYPKRLQIFHLLSREPQVANYLRGSLERKNFSTELPDSLIRGRIDREQISRLLKHIVSAERVSDWFLCGPEAMVVEAANTLDSKGIDPAHVHKELFASGTARRPGSASKPKPSDSQAQPCAISVAYQGKETAFALQPDSEYILDAAMRDRDDLPYACQSGACGTCRARLLEGTASMDANMALEDDEVEAGYILTCQARPTSPTLRVDFDG